VSVSDAAASARAVTDAILADLAKAERGVVVDSPPGAGKSTLVVAAAASLAERGERVMVVGQTNEQVDDLIDRMASEHGVLQIGRLSAQDYTPAPRVARHANVTVRTAVADLIDHPLVIATAAKWALLDTETRWPWAIIDEAYQMRSDSLLRIARLFDKALFVGDPGQLDPFSTVETERWLGLNWDPMSSAVAVLLTNNPGIPVHTLPVSWRLPATAAPVVSAAFYPFSGFTAATELSDRAMRWTTRPFGMTSFDLALQSAADTGWALYELPHRHTLRTDAEAVDACAELAARVLLRGAVAVSEQGAHDVTADRIAIGVAHRDQAAAVRRALRARAAAYPVLSGSAPENSGLDNTGSGNTGSGNTGSGNTGSGNTGSGNTGLGNTGSGNSARDVTKVVADTANRLQGREFDVMIMLHPLSGRRDATAFHLEAGRLCVLASRHRHACIVVARAGIPELLDAHPSAEPVHLGVPVKFPDGWEAQQSFMAHLARYRVPK
jgi:energy-coupling factor transporter ATP-binding protein EcfA2